MRGEERKTAHLGPRLSALGARTISGDSSWSVTSYILDVAELTRETFHIYPIHLSVSGFYLSVSENFDRQKRIAHLGLLILLSAIY